MGTKEQSPKAIPSDLQMYKLTDLEGMLGLSHKTLWRYVKAGKLKAVKIASRWMVSEQTLRDFLAQGTTGDSEK